MCAHRKHQLQQCVVEKGVQVLKRVPGPCAIVNRENNCPYVRKQLLVRIIQMFGADPT